MQPETRTIPAAGGAGIVQEHHDGTGCEIDRNTESHDVGTVVLTIKVPLPNADQAERDLAGCCVDNPAAVHLALERVSYAHFRDARCWEAIIASTRCGRDDDVDTRIRSVAAYIEAEPAFVRQWVDERPVQLDKSGALARRIAGAANARLEVLDLVDRLIALGAEVAQ